MNDLFIHPVNPGLALLDQLRLKTAIHCPAGDCAAICRGQKLASNVLESRKVKTLRVAQSIIATKYKKTVLDRNAGNVAAPVARLRSPTEAGKQQSGGFGRTGIGEHPINLMHQLKCLSIYPNWCAIDRRAADLE